MIKHYVYILSSQSMTMLKLMRKLYMRIRHCKKIADLLTWIHWTITKPFSFSIRIGKQEKNIEDYAIRNSCSVDWFLILSWYSIIPVYVDFCSLLKPRDKESLEYWWGFQENIFCEECEVCLRSDWRLKNTLRWDHYNFVALKIFRDRSL